MGASQPMPGWGSHPEPLTNEWGQNSREIGGGRLMNEPCVQGGWHGVRLFVCVCH